MEPLKDNFDPLWVKFGIWVWIFASGKLNILEYLNFPGFQYSYRNFVGLKYFNFLIFPLKIFVYGNFLGFQYSNKSSGNIVILEFSMNQVSQYSNISSGYSGRCGIFQSSNIPIFQYFL